MRFSTLLMLFVVLMVIFLLISLFWPESSLYMLYGKKILGNYTSLGYFIVTLVSGVLCLYYVLEDRSFTPSVMTGIFAFILACVGGLVIEGIPDIGILSIIRYIPLLISIFLLGYGTVLWLSKWIAIRNLRSDVKNFQRRLDEIRESIEKKREDIVGYLKECQKISEEAENRIKKWDEARVTYR